MRIVHFTDIHLSIDNYEEFNHNYKQALIDDLRNYHSEKKIDLIIITGDLVDKGGHSLLDIEKYKLHKNPYFIFEEVFINPISNSLGISKEKFLFIPGNHDVNEKSFLWYDECEMSKNESKDIELYLKKNYNEFYYNLRIKEFKEFEENYHKNTPLYKYTNNESTYVYEIGGYKIGFLLINDSWRCKSKKLIGEDDKIYFGYNQFYNGLERLDDTDLNICLFHHSVTDNYKEKEQVERILNQKNIELFLYGHYHSNNYNQFYTPNSSCLGFRGKAALNKPEETNIEYLSGYQILDFDLDYSIISKVHYRTYDFKNINFIPDLHYAKKDGIDKNNSNENKGFNILRNGMKIAKSKSFDKSEFKH